MTNPTTPSVVAEPAALTPETLRIGGKYNWKGQPERLVYMGSKSYRDNGVWHQFALVTKPDSVWSEVHTADLSFFEETPVAASQAASHSAPAERNEFDVAAVMNQLSASPSSVAAFKRLMAVPVGAETVAPEHDEIQPLEARVIEAARTVAKIWDEHGYPTEIHALSMPLNALSDALAALASPAQAPSTEPTDAEVAHGLFGIPASEWAKVEAFEAAQAPSTEPAKWIDDPHDIEQGQMLNPAWLDFHGVTAREVHQQAQTPYSPATPVQPVPASLSDEQALSMIVSHAIPGPSFAVPASPAVEVASGWKLVPIKPTEAMIAAVLGLGYPFNTVKASRPGFLEAYRGMLDAAPAIATPPAAAVTEGASKPFAYWVYVPAERRGELVHDLDDAIDDLTNCQCEVTKLFDHPAAGAVHGLTEARFDELRGLVAEMADNDTYETEYDGRMYSICHGCGAQDGEPHRSATCVYLRAKAALAATTTALPASNEVKP